MQKNENRPGYKKTKVGWVPVGWAVSTFGDEFQIQLGKMLNKTATEGDSHQPYLANINVRWGSFELSNTRTMSFSEKDKEKFSLEHNDLLVCEGGEIGRCAIWKNELTPCYFQKALHRLRPLNANIDVPFTMHFLHEAFTSPRIKGLIGETSIAHFTRERFISFPISKPSLPEQEGIAGVLECWDRGIRTLENKIEKKRLIKKGLMQRLLSGQLRLPGFSEDWKTVKLGKVLAEKPQYGINAPSVPLSDDLPTYLRITDISEDGRFLDESKTSVDHPDAENYILSSGDLVFARTGASTGKTFLYSSNHGKLIFAGFLIRVSTDRNRLEPAFLKFYTETHDYWNWINVMSTRSGQPGINGQEYAQLQIPLPPLKEQQTIAEVLEAADGEIEVLERKLGSWRDQKKYLLNNLVTGTIRLPQFINH